MKCKRHEIAKPVIVDIKYVHAGSGCDAMGEIACVFEKIVDRAVIAGKPAR